MVVATIHQRHVHRLPCQRLRRGEPAEPSTDEQDMREH
jgi:hypothetical protein